MQTRTDFAIQRAKHEATTQVQLKQVVYSTIKVYSTGVKSFGIASI